MAQGMFRSSPKNSSSRSLETVMVTFHVRLAFLTRNHRVTLPKVKRYFRQKSFSLIYDPHNFSFMSNLVSDQSRLNEIVSSFNEVQKIQMHFDQTGSFIKN